VQWDDLGVLNSAVEPSDSEYYGSYLAADYQARVQPNLPYTAECARQVLLLHECTHVSDTALTNALYNGTILGTGLTMRDVRIANIIYGPCLLLHACLQFGATR
jgi:hypothetical protein